MDNGWKKYNKQPQVWGCEIGYTPSVITRMIQLTPPAKVDCPDGADGIELGLPDCNVYSGIVHYHVQIKNSLKV